MSDMHYEVFLSCLTNDDWDMTFSLLPMCHYLGLSALHGTFILSLGTTVFTWTARMLNGDLIQKYEKY